MRHVTIEAQGKTHTLKVPDVASWKAVASTLMTLGKPGRIIALSGELGAGKTTCVQALAQALGIIKSPQSPTFSLMRTYIVPGNASIARLIHVDAYRLEDERELQVLDLDEELRDEKSLLVLEWPEKIPQWIEAHRASVITCKISLN